MGTYVKTATGYWRSARALYLGTKGFELSGASGPLLRLRVRQAAAGQESSPERDEQPRRGFW